jgi:hypothetical protein
MINLSPSTAADLEQIKRWAVQDPYHFHQGQPEWWLTDAPGSLLAFCLMDQRGPLSYVRLDLEGEYVRIHTQFAPDDVASKRRLVVGMMQCIHALIGYFKGGTKGLVFNSISPTLIAFMDKHLGFKPIGGGDYRLLFEQEITTC